MLFSFILFLFLFSPSYSLNISSESVCNEKMVFVLDSSSSINNKELYGKQHTYKKFKTEIINIINNNDIIPSNIALLTFDTKPEIIIHFNSSLDKTNIIDTVNRLKYHRNTKHTNLNLALETIEQSFFKENFNIIKVFFFTDTRIGHEFMQPDEDHYRNIKNRFNNHYWNNDYIERYIYYDGNQINQSVLDLFPIKNQYRIYRNFISNCSKQKCIDKFCIKTPEKYHKICINDSNKYVMYNSHCHYLCSNRDIRFLKNLFELDKCYTNSTYNITPMPNSTYTSSYIYNKSSYTQNTIEPVPHTILPFIQKYNSTTSTSPINVSHRSYSGLAFLNYIIFGLIIIIVIVICILLCLHYKKKNKRNIELIKIPEKPDTYNNRLFNNTIYNMDL